MTEGVPALLYAHHHLIPLKYMLEEEAEMTGL